MVYLCAVQNFGSTGKQASAGSIPAMHSTTLTTGGIVYNNCNNIVLENITFEKAIAMLRGDPKKLTPLSEDEQKDIDSDDEAILKKNAKWAIDALHDCGDRINDIELINIRKCNLGIRIITNNFDYYYDPYDPYKP